MTSCFCNENLSKFRLGFCNRQELTSATRLSVFDFQGCLHCRQNRVHRYLQVKRMQMTRHLLWLRLFFS